MEEARQRQQRRIEQGEGPRTVMGREYGGEYQFLPAPKHVVFKDVQGGPLAADLPACARRVLDCCRGCRVVVQWASRSARQ
jgi:hypothetical protein